MQGWVVMAQEILLKLKDDPELLDSAIYSETKLSSTSPTLKKAPQAPLSVVVDDVAFTHLSNAEPTLEHVSLTIDAGSYVAIVGPSGAGKTTLVDLLLGLYDPDKGTVRLGLVRIL